MTLRAHGLTRRYQRGTRPVTALSTVDLELSPGELAVAAGPSGSGKTTLLSLLAGLDTPDAGTVDTVPPLPPGVPPAALGWRDLAFVPQSATLLEELTVRENVALPVRLAPGTPPVDIDELLDRLDLAHLGARYPSQVSGGEQQRTAIARALVLSPHVLLADEPTGHQDRVRVHRVLTVLRAHAYAGHTVLLSSHDEDVIAGADRLLRLVDGRLAGDARPAART